MNALSFTYRRGWFSRLMERKYVLRNRALFGLMVALGCVSIYYLSWGLGETLADIYEKLQQCLYQYSHLH